MMKNTTAKIHPLFKLNQISYSREELSEVAYSLIKEGDAHEISIGDFLMDWLSEQQEITVQTSGSTGEPKSISLSKERMVNSALATGQFFNLEAGDRALLCLSTNFIAGKMMLVRAMVLGLELDYVVPSSDPLTGVKQAYDFCAMVPMQLEKSLEEINQIKTLIVGGAAISLALKKGIQLSSVEVFETYGMTETITHIALKKINPIYTGLEDSPFKALAEVSLSVDERDCLLIRAPGISPDVIVTNDIVELISDTEFVWQGRFDNIINSGGLKLIPEQVEQKLLPIIKSRFILTGVPDEQLGEKMILIVEEENIDGDLLDKIKSLSTLEPYEIPKKIIGISKFNETVNGKLKRSESIAKILPAEFL